MEKKNTKKAVIAIVILVMLCAAALMVYKQFAPKGTTGDKTVTVKVVHADDSVKEFEYQTEEAYLGDVIKDNGLVEGEMGQYGLFIIAADGETAEEGKQQWWCLTKGGAQVNTSADQTPIKDGDTYELTLTEGY